MAVCFLISCTRCEKLLHIKLKLRPLIQTLLTWSSEFKKKWVWIWSFMRKTKPLASPFFSFSFFSFACSSGPIPDTLGNLVNLTKLYLSDNKLFGKGRRPVVILCLSILFTHPLFPLSSSLASGPFLVCSRLIYHHSTSSFAVTIFKLRKK